MPPKLTIQKTIAAPVERVFEAWTDPNIIAKWFAPGNMTIPEATAEAKVGGRYRIVMQEDNGEQYITGGEYKEVVENELIICSWKWEHSEFDTLLTVNFRAIDDSTTEIDLLHEQFPDEERKDSHIDGWTKCLNNLANHFS